MRGSIWLSESMDGAGGPGGVKMPCAEAIENWTLRMVNARAVAIRMAVFVLITVSFDGCGLKTVKVESPHILVALESDWSHRLKVHVALRKSPRNGSVRYRSQASRSRSAETSCWLSSSNPIAPPIFAAQNDGADSSNRVGRGSIDQWPQSSSSLRIA